jgi:hypothetical protein|tara:strand:- start:638 stop:1594 length:957 start_codon:yes stop_codon:yes gene_type:complete
MKVAFFTEMGWEGKVDRTTHNNMRTEFAWMSTLDADHYNIHAPTLKQDYDLGIVIVPKSNPEINLKPLKQQINLKPLKQHCDKIAIQQEGPHWYFQDYPLTHQFHFHNHLMETDYIFCHNEVDKKYYEGITNKPVFVNRSLMLPEDLVPRSEWGDAVIIGGNFVSWYGGFDSYMVASIFQPEMQIYAPSMGRKQKMENQIEDIKYLPYQLWKDWINTLSQFHVGIHMMRTHAAGTFAMNCAFHGIPCIGYKGLDTQEILHPSLSVELSDIKEARRLAVRLKEEDGFYDECSRISRTRYEDEYSEEEWLKRFNDFWSTT